VSFGRFCRSLRVRRSTKGPQNSRGVPIARHDINAVHIGNSVMTEQATSPQFADIQEVIVATGLSRTMVYKLVRRGCLKAVRFGKSIRVPRPELERLIRKGC